MDILILGGTKFLGPELVEAAGAKGHAVTLFNRGRTNPQMFPEVEKLRGDRDPNQGDGLKTLAGRKWDAVIDTSGYVPRHVKASAELLAPNIKQYVFISTISVYPENAQVGLNEETPVATIPDETIEEVTGETYGPLKALCEQAVERAMPGRAANIRPGLIVGPNDPTDRFTYWPVRIDRGGEIVVPAPQDAPVQLIDVRDLAEWTIRMIEDGHTGVFNATGPKARLSFAEVVHGCRAVTSSTVSFVWVDETFLIENQVGPWMEMPLWVPEAKKAGIVNVSIDKAIAHGLTFRPLAVTALDTLDWHKRTRGEEYAFPSGPRGAGMSAAKEAAVLKAWKERSPTP